MGSENASFLTPKVLAEGQTSGSGGWVKKFSRDNNVGADGLPMVGCQSKNNELDLQSLIREGANSIFRFSKHVRSRQAEYSVMQEMCGS